ncbi:MAG: radical SAM family heme chaperone HemW [Acidimicrobiia bacterium]|nr:radical SAM family heme chaperone HemW [Acidimicrobiia bacterium]MXY73519.1 radical SAM family heme chaperone HemW [Acidimicrobiia bacterium]MYB78867.1 radical SAM family heme chaperone HemW [Acidimicrobiia bacterium]MYG92770.1 radical SAM family heme chaperone HemW [Acidimicrobiia bacterium]
MKPSGEILPPDDPRLADQAGGWRSAYLHVPFCEEVCPYCDFAVVAGRDQLASRYGKALVAEIRSAPDWGPLDAVNFGGGTPSRMAPELLERILQELSSRFGIRRGAEVSLEANPEDWTLQKAESLVTAGFNRVSLGAQSFDTEVLSYLGRRHTPARIGRAVTVARKAGFVSVNLDLIMGSPPESPSSWTGTLRKAMETDPDHLSTYSLTVEPGTVLWKRVRAGACPPDPDRQAERWEEADRESARAGLVRYEISNAARLGHPCRYNLSVWGQGEYLGFGNGAHSFRDGRRWENLRGLDRYLDAVESGRSPNHRFELIEGWSAETERVLLGIRRTAGVRIGRAGEALWKSARGRELRRAGVIGLHEGRLVVERPLLTDEVSRAILSMPPPENAELGKVFAPES